MSESEMHPAPTAVYPPPAPAPRKRSLLWLWILLGLIGLGFLIFLLALPVIIIAGAVSGPLPKSGPGVAIIRVEGIITAGRSGGGFMEETGAGSETIVEQIDRATHDSRVKAILVRINSPGGSAAGAEEVYQALLKAREKLPVVISMGDVAASGGYYIAAAGDEIYCNGGTLTGSIGVITSHLDLSGLMKKIGVSYQDITTGEFKAMGSPSRPLTEREQALIKALLGDIYQQFVGAVAEGRKLPKEKVLKIADGRVFTGRQAQKLGLVDKIGGFQQALSAAAQRAGLRGRPRKIEYGPKGFFDLFFGRDDSTEALMNALARQLLVRQGAKELAGSVLR